MSEDSGERPISDIESLMEIIDLKSVIFNEVSARRTDDKESKPTQTPMKVTSSVGEDHIGVRCKVAIEGAGGAYVSDATASFSLERSVEIAEATIFEFVRRVGVMVVYPYLRTSLSDSAARIGRKAPLLSLLRPGDVKLARSDTPHDEPK